MKKDVIDIDSRIKKIDKLLENSNYFDEYINKISKKEITIPDKLNEKILKSIEEFKEKSKEKSKEKNQEKNKNSYIYEILKIAACTVFSLIIWNISPKIDDMKNIEKDKSQEIKFNKITMIAEKIEKASNFLVSPIEMKEEKK